MAESQDIYTVKEILTMVVIPRLDKIDAKLDSKADIDDLVTIGKRLKILEDASLNPDRVKDLIRSALEDSDARGFATRERVLALGLFAISLTSLILTLVAQFL